MSPKLSIGKIPADLLAELLASDSHPPELLLGPQIGEDACAIEVPGGALIAASDPIGRSQPSSRSQRFPFE